MKSSEEHGSAASRSKEVAVGCYNWGLLGLLVMVKLGRVWDASKKKSSGWDWEKGERRERLNKNNNNKNNNKRIKLIV